MEQLSADRGIRGIVPDFLWPSGSLGKTVSEKGDHEGAQNICMSCISFPPPPSLHSCLTEVSCCVVGRRKYHIPQLSQVLPLPACVQRTLLPDVLLPTTHPMSAWVPFPGTPPKLHQ